MKIYRAFSFRITRSLPNGARFSIMGTNANGFPSLGWLHVRGEFLRDHHINGKTLAKLLPAWAKAKTIRSLGPKVTAFYAENDKVVTRLHHSGFIVGSDDYHDWTETQPDPFRGSRLYRESLGERV